MKACVPDNVLIRLAGNELSAAEREAVMRHLDECATCRGAWEEMRSTWDLLGQITATPPARDLTGPVLAGAAAGQARRGRWAWAARVAAVIALAGGLGIMAGLLKPPRTRWASTSPTVSDEQVVAALGLDALDDADLLAGLFETEETPIQEQPS